MRARLTTVTKTYFACPNCGSEHAHAISHLLDDTTASHRSGFGPWSCDDCGRSIRGTVNADNTVDLELLDEQAVLCYTLLAIQPQTDPVYFVVKDKDYGRGRNPPFDGKEYFFEQHTCPINWLRGDVVEVISEGDTDPHGLATYVTSVDIPPDFNEDEAGEAEWRGLFPEAFSAQTAAPSNPFADFAEALRTGNATVTIIPLNQLRDK